MKVINVRFIVEDGVEAESFMQAIAMGMQGDVLGTAELINDGWGHLMPDMGPTAHAWI